MLGMFFSGFSFISTHISLDLLFLGSAEAYIGWGGKVNRHLLASCVRNIRTKNYQSVIIGFQVTVENVNEKNIPDIFDCNLKTNYHILIIFGTNIPETTCHQLTI